MRLITDLSELGAIESAWRTLAVARGNAFVTPDWFRSWFRHYGGKATPFVIAVNRPEGSLEGVMPLVRTSEGRRRSLRFAGASLGDYFQPACHGDDEARVVAACARILQERRSEWSAAILHNTDAGAFWPEQLACATGLKLLGGPSSSMPYVPLNSTTWERYLADRSANFRSQLGRSTRRLERDHSVEFRATTSADELDRDMATFFALHGERQQGETRLGEPRAQAFHRDFALQALKQGWLRLSLLEVDGNPIAALYAWRIGPRYGYYNSGFDPAWSRYSAGFLLLNRTIRDAIEEGAEEYDLMLGDEQYKQRFTSAERRVRALMVAPQLDPMRIAFGLEVSGRRTMASLPPWIGATARRVLRPIARRLPGAR